MAVAMAGKPRKVFTWSRFEPFLYIAPLMLLLFGFNFYTFFMGARMSLTDAQGINPGEFVGFANFVEALTKNRDFWPAIWHTVYYAIGCLLTQIPAAFVLAVILNGLLGRLRGLLKASFYVPVLINTVVAALIFRMLFNQTTGVINWAMGLLGLPDNTNWLFDSTYSVPLMIVVALWQWMGYHMVYLLASLQAIDPTIYEVAKLDGASWFRTMFQIILPLMRPALTFTVIMSTMGALQVFEYPFMLFPNAGYGPGKAAMTAVPFIYFHGFSNRFELGFATAAGWLLFVMILAISLFQLRFFGLGKVEEN